MVSLEGSPRSTTRFPLSRSLSPSTAKLHRHAGRSMRTIRSKLYQTDETTCSSLPSPARESREVVEFHSENLTESVVDMRLGELAAKYSNSGDGDVGGGNRSAKSASSLEEELLEFSRAFNDFSACSSDVSGELQRLANLPPPQMYDNDRENSDPNPEIEPCVGFLQRESFSTEIIESISPEDLQPTVKLCVDGLRSPSTAVKRSAAAKLRLLAKNRSENRALIGESGAIPELVSLVKSSSDSLTQEHAVTALLNLSLHEDNRKSIMQHSGAVKSLIHVLKTGTDTSKQNAACALLSLALIEENKSSIGASGAVPPLVSLLINGTDRGKKDAITTLYKLCTLAVNKERAVSCGVVRPLVEFVGEREKGLAEKAMVVLSSIAGIEEGREAIVAEGGIGALVEVIEDGSDKGKEFAVATLLALCSESVRNRGLLVREGGIPPLVALSQTGNTKAKHRAEKLLAYLRESRQGATSSSP